MLVVKRAVVLGVLLAAALSVSTAHAADVCTFKVVLKPGESCDLLFKLPKGAYTCRATRICGNADHLRIEAEVQGNEYSARTKYRSSTTEVAFKVAQDCDVWKITLTNASKTETLSVTAKLIKD